MGSLPSLTAGATLIRGKRGMKGKQMTNISSYIEQVARAYWGEPTIKRGHTYRWGNHGSKEIDLRKGTFFDFQENVGGGVIDLVKMHEPTSFQTIPEILEKKFGIARQQQNTIQPAKFMSKCYSYVDEHGEVRYEVVRFEPKDFRQRVPDGSGGYRWSMKDVEALPYNLPAILARLDEPIFVVEGEKAADALISAGFVPQQVVRGSQRNHPAGQRRAGAAARADRGGEPVWHGQPPEGG